MVLVLISISFEYICCKNAMLLLPQFYSAGQLFICNEQKCILPFFCRIIVQTLLLKVLSISKARHCQTYWFVETKTRRIEVYKRIHLVLSSVILV
jgi:hypothetical protein